MGTLSVLEKANKKDGKLEILRLSREFGKKGSLIGGFDKAGGEKICPPYLLIIEKRAPRVVLIWFNTIPQNLEGDAFRRSLVHRLDVGDQVAEFFQA